MLVVESDQPPGRIDMRGKMVRRFQRESGMMPTAHHYHRTVIDDAPSPRKVVGIGCDMSGSMWGAQEALGVTRWMLTEALSMTQGEVAAVIFGEDAWPIQSPRDRLREIEIYNADDRYENYMEAFSLLDAELDLIDGDGAKLLVWFTDGHFNQGSAVRYAEQTMDECRKAGVTVLWVNVSGYFARPDAYGHGTIVDTHGELTPLEIAKRIGQAVADEYIHARIHAAS